MNHVEVRCTLIGPPNYEPLATNTHVLVGHDAKAPDTPLAICLLSPHADLDDPIVLAAGTVALLRKSQFPFGWTEGADWQWNRFYAHKWAGLALPRAPDVYDLPRATWELAWDPLRPRDRWLVLQLPVRSDDPQQWAKAVDWLLEGR